MRSYSLLLTALLVAAGSPAGAQTPPPKPEPPRLWDVQVGASFVGTSGNSDTSTAGVDFLMNRRWPVWSLQSTATAVRASDAGRRTAERYLGSVRGERVLTKLIKFSTGERAERDQLSGIDFRSILDAGLGWALVRAPRWTLDATTGMAWNHEQWVVGPNRNAPAGLLQLVSVVPFGMAGNTTERFTFYPDFKEKTAYRSEFEASVQAALNARLALKLAYLLRYSNAPVPGFVKTDNTATASIVLRWRAEALAPGAR
jgi:putative salt-induced outer membrane protein YdiY